MPKLCRAFFLLLAALTAVGCNNTAPQSGSSGAPGQGTAGQEIKIGCYFSMTGGTATFGESSMNGIRLAVDQINANGGVLGKKLTYVLEDDQGQADKAALAVQKLINQENVDVIVGDVASSNSIAGGNIAQAARVPMITPSSTNPKVTQIGDYIFRACFTDPFQGYAAATFAVQNLKAKTAAILTDKQSDYSIGLSRYFRDTFQKDGGKVLGEEFYIQGDADFKGQLARLQSLKPDLIFIPGYYTEVGLIARQARDLGYTAPLLGGDGWDSPKLGNIGGKALNNSYYSVHVDLSAERPQIKALVAAYQSRYHTNVDTLAVLAYDTVNLLADAYKRAGSTDKDKLRDALAATKDFQGVSGTITMNSERDPIKSAVIVAFQDGRTRYVATIQPPGTAPASSPVGAASGSPAAPAAPGAPSPATARPASPPAQPTAPTGSR